MFTCASSFFFFLFLSFELFQIFHGASKMLKERWKELYPISWISDLFPYSFVPYKFIRHCNEVEWAIENLQIQLHSMQIKFHRDLELQKSFMQTLAKFHENLHKKKGHADLYWLINFNQTLQD